MNIPRPVSWVPSSRQPRASDFGGAAPAGRAPRLYQAAYSVLRYHINERRLPTGLILLEGRIADALGMSRAPIKRALALLRNEGLIHRYNGRGYLVGPMSADVQPRRGDLREIGLSLPEPLAHSIGRFAWERIYAEVEAEVAKCIPFGTYRVLESGICDQYGVSRTVAREVLSRLRDRALIEKDRHSHWIAGPLTASALTEHFEIRQLLEPAALLAVASDLDRTELIRMRDRLAAAEADFSQVTSTMIDAFEQDLHVACVLKVKNRRMATTIIQSQLPFVTNSLFHQYLGVAADDTVLPEHRLVFEHLIMDATQAAASALAAHLEAAQARTRARLKVLSLFPEPAAAPYIEHVH